MMKIKNPILRGFNPDPSICRVGEDYYIAVSTFEWFPGVQIYHSKDLINWNLVAHPLNRISQLDMKGNADSGGIWAPCLSYSDNKFWLIYTDVKVTKGIWKDCYNYLVTCETIDGEWSEPVKLNGSGFDPSLFHDKNGKKYLLNMLFDNRVYNHRFAGIVMQEYSPEEEKLIGESKLIFKGTDLKLTEGPHLYQIGDYYYLLTAEGGTKYEHAATIARSKNIEGPYEIHPDNPILTAWDKPINELQKCGHASIVHTHTDEWHLVHLTGRPLPSDEVPGTEVRGYDKETGKPLPHTAPRGYCPLGRETAIQKLEWIDGWPYVVGGKEGSIEIDAPNMKEVKWEPSFKELDHFDNDKLNINFQSLRIPLTEDIMSLTENPGNMRLYGKESLISKFTQALVARRWQSFNFDAATGVSFNPDTFQQSAGLVCYYNTENWTTIDVTWNEEKGRVIDIISCDNFEFSQPLAQNMIPVPENVEYVHLKVEVRVEEYKFFYSFDGVEWKEIPTSFESKKLSDDYVGGGACFTGAFVGMHCQDVSGNNKSADFDYFMYKENLI
ncbi:glycoside hydrolase family 43 protein [Clostridium beijerinckii]|uniref:glycoside hydrolase family 43 protein n=1 Tax=Clostridium beijerinckii TaxID=1520 RepID=UPI0003D39A56|nr:glycoside hydrolase family 43 protein [Clostridium beijerinckii]ALB44719.1 glycoside hydrolase family 43 protein [Clostridium beijerinckii NRRL B-598]